MKRRALLAMLGTAVTAGCSTNSGQGGEQGIDVYVNNNLRGSPISVTVELQESDATLFRQFGTLQKGPASGSESIGAVEGLEEETEISVSVTVDDLAMEKTRTVGIGCQSGNQNTEVVVSIEPGEIIEISSNGCEG